MRIISKFKDYYDSAVGYGIDPKLVYVRNTQELEWNSTSVYHRSGKTKEQIESDRMCERLAGHATRMPTWGDAWPSVIAFCGKVYPFYYWEGRAHYTLESLVQAVRTYRGINFNNKEQLSALLEPSKQKDKWTRFRWSIYRLNKNSWKQYQKTKVLDIGDEIHRYFKSPILFYQTGLKKVLVINPILRKYNFASQVDPFTAFQELSMYMGNNLAEQMDPNVKISDELKRDTHGFDEWSFKKPGKNSKVK